MFFKKKKKKQKEISTSMRKIEGLGDGSRNGPLRYSITFSRNVDN